MKYRGFTIKVMTYEGESHWHVGIDETLATFEYGTAKTEAEAERAAKKWIDNWKKAHPGKANLPKYAKAAKKLLGCDQFEYLLRRAVDWGVAYEYVYEAYGAFKEQEKVPRKELYRALQDGARKIIWVSNLLACLRNGGINTSIRVDKKGNLWAGKKKIKKVSKSGMETEYDPQSWEWLTEATPRNQTSRRKKGKAG